MQGVGKEPKITHLVKKLLEQQGEQPLQPASVLELLAAQPIQVRRQQELAAMGRIFGLVEWASKESWVYVFPPRITAPPNHSR